MMQASGTSSSNSSFSKKQLVQQRTTTTDSEPTISYPLVKLPHPFLTEYCITPNTTTPATLTLKHLSQPAEGTPLTFSLHNDSLSFLPLAFLPSGQVPKKADNTSWARARRAPFTQFAWTNDAAPSLAQIWNLIHAIYLTHPAIEYFRLTLSGTKNALIRKELLTTGLAVPHPKLWGFDKEKRNVGDETDFTDELLVLRATFWQGAGSPAGPRPIWACSSDHQPAFLKPILAAKSGQGEDRVPSSLYPPFPHTQHFTMSFPAAPVYALHPVRAPKPTPGSIVYSRYIPSLNEHFSLEALDWEDEEHVKLFNEWQNDERVAEGWNERGTIEEHTAYLKGLGEDPHVLCLFGRFEGVRMAYFELYWAAEDHFGAHSSPSPYARGRHSLVGNPLYRGPERVNAWYSSCIHYCFLDEPRTMHVVGEPKASGGTILAYENAQGLVVERMVDFAHKRAVSSVCGREKWFQLAPIWWDGRKRGESSDRIAWEGREGGSKL